MLVIIHFKDLIILFGFKLMVYNNFAMGNMICYF